MGALSSHAVARRWPPKHAEIVQLYSYPTPNGIKVSIMLEEAELAYEPHLVDLLSGDQFSPEFLSLNPNNKIPALIDPHGPDGEPIALFESAAILLYLAERTGRFIPKVGASRYEAIQWLFFQAAAIGPMFGQVGFFNKFAGREYEDKRPLRRYVDESRRLLGVLERRLERREWIMGDQYTIVDMSVFPWVRNLIGSYGAAELVEITEFANVLRALDCFQSRPAVIRGSSIPARP